jgi:histidyl-tRNA synthetase
MAKGMLRASRPVPTAVLVAVDSEETRTTAIEVAEQLRARGVPTEVAPRAEKFGRQIRYADRRGIPFVWFGGTVGGEVKDIRTGEQIAADPASWMPSAQDLKPRVLSATPSC